MMASTKWTPKYKNGAMRIFDESGRDILNTSNKELNEDNALLASGAPEMLKLIEFFVRDNMLSIVGEEMAEQLVKKFKKIIC